MHAGYHHEQFGAEFRKFVDVLNEEFGPVDADAAANSLNTTKRILVGGVASGPDAKKIKLDIDKVKEACLTLDTIKDRSTLLQANLMTVKSKQPLVLDFAVGSDFVLVNNDRDNDAHWGQGTLVCAFGRGKFKAKGDGEEVDTEKIYFV